MNLFRRIFVIVLFLITALSAQAQNRRSAVSVNGTDLNPCTVPSPCRTFSRAMAVTDTEGEIIALDSGGYGAFTVDRAMSIAAIPQAYAAIAPTSGSAITVNTPSTAQVTIRGLTLVGHGATIGINFNRRGSLHVENCTISGFTSEGVGFNPLGDATLLLTDSVISDSPGFGLFVDDGLGIATVYVERSHFLNIGDPAFGFRAGLWAGSGARVVARHSSAVNNGRWGFAAGCSSGTCTLDLEKCDAVGNLWGIRAEAQGGTATIRVSNSTITRNSEGLFAGTGQNLLTRNNNTVEGNTSNGLFTGSFTAK